ncbi:phosphoglycerate mutase-like protein [Dacryopinax primogenitus]|uniref:Phosphoglycerate mutase-like protein n=1 Tax=Dacryopinax primogenitus (strain DJM 731) TaxID=1858805 RepID=M5FZE1_DACPD|nr:phosphoglycerate mutase-like protein [Dacryopinax primogenitus]EJU01884.1 phosphoglycerate mutase-like protein [Dacryopinax primogenitus]
MEGYIYIARHGFRLSWITQTWKSPTATPRDPPLAAYGHDQTKEMTAYFLALPAHERPTVIYSSPYYRCLQTANPVADALNIPLYVEHGLSEWYMRVKPNTGLLPRPHHASSLKEHFPNIDDSRQSVYLPSRKGEDIPEVHRRADETLKALLHTANSPRMLLVTHAATAIALIRGLARDPDLPVRVGCCTITTFRRHGVINWHPIGDLASAAHLSNGVERDWGFEDVSLFNGEVVEDEGEGEGPDTDQGPVGLMIDLPMQVTEISPRL